MKPAPLAYERASDVQSAVKLAQQEEAVVKFLAGSQSLGPMLNLRLVQPDLLVDITHIPELTQVDELRTPILKICVCPMSPAAHCRRWPGVSPTGRCATGAQSAAAWCMPIRRPTGSAPWPQQAQQ